SGSVRVRRTHDTGPSSLGELAKVTAMDPAATGRPIRPLEAEGLATRGSTAGAGRVTVVPVTPKGRAIRRRIAEVRDRHMEDVLDAWSVADRAALARLLGRLVDDLRSVHYRTVADADTNKPDTEKEKLAR